jgi:hypothetical protein
VAQDVHDVGASLDDGVQDAAGCGTRTSSSSSSRGENSLSN